MFGIFKKKKRRTDDDRIRDVFEIVENNPEHEAHFYAELAHTVQVFKEQINCSDMSYSDMLFALRPDQCHKIAAKQRQVQDHMEAKGGDYAFKAGFIGMIAISLEGKAGNANASPETIDFVNKVLVRVDDLANEDKIDPS